MPTPHIAGDLDYFNKCLSLPHHQSNSPCAFCSANVNDLPWSDFNSTAGWKDHIYTPDNWPHGHGGPFELPGVSVHHVHADYLHCKLLGTDQIHIWLCALVAGVWPGIANSAGPREDAGKSRDQNLAIITIIYNTNIANIDSSPWPIMAQFLRDIASNFMTCVCSFLCINDTSFLSFPWITIFRNLPDLLWHNPSQ